MIKIIATGNIGKDAELKQIGGNNYACFSIAITEKVKGESRTTWVDVVKYDKDGKLTPYLKKGVRLQVIGKPTTSGYTNKNGDIVSTLTIWVMNELEFQGGMKKEEGNGGGLDNIPQDDDSDNLPF
ncbi:single-stranded DNA-binding protein [Butyricimonas sp.]|uniref:single-stranded DNA-binding protein n=1 Tax=Butyricimonas sp. TaxID=1969738 RepID=UPI001B20613F|nr:single-stranded DNA-binding protein [Butyricimonas sp.]MBO4960592.1 single-stranded DNA-binding protein [Butyricimonas sp.]